MAIRVMIQGDSGSGKTTSLRNFDEKEILYVNIGNKPLPFRKKFETLSSDNVEEIEKALLSTDKKVVVLDDVQYIMANSYMRRILENGWEKYSEIGNTYFRLLDVAEKMPEDIIIYYMSHTEVDEAGVEKAKTIGRTIDKYVTIEGKFTVVLKTVVAEGTYNFVTQNNGHDRVKSPIGMFEDFSIDNDLKYVDEKIRNYYEISGALSDAEIKEKDQEVANENVAPKVRKKKKEEEEEPKRRRRRKSENVVVDDEELPF